MIGLFCGEFFVALQLDGRGVVRQQKISRRPSFKFGVIAQDSMLSEE